MMFFYLMQFEIGLF